MRVFVLELVGMASFIAAGFFVAPAVGLAVIGVMAFGIAFALSRTVAKDDKK
jgi:mannose/fructose/N-acetylgalactosamine-specific phosphotransferase system component IIC